MSKELRKTIMDAMRSVSERADEFKAGCATFDGEWPDAEDKAIYDAEVELVERLRVALASLSDAAQAPLLPTLRDLENYRHGLLEAFNQASMIEANRQGRTAEETCAYLVRSLAKLANNEALIDAAPVAPQAAGDAARAPAGWKLVPVELTDEMRSAANKHDKEMYQPTWASTYRAMLAAAPVAADAAAPLAALDSSATVIPVTPDELAKLGAQPDERAAYLMEAAAIASTHCTHCAELIRERIGARATAPQATVKGDERDLSAFNAWMQAQGEMPSLLDAWKAGRAATLTNEQCEAIETAINLIRTSVPAYGETVRNLQSLLDGRADEQPTNEPRNVRRMTRAEFEAHLRVCYQHDNVREHVNAPDFAITADQERRISERVERSYPTEKVCPGCHAFDIGMLEVHFVHDCPGCIARMQKIAGNESAWSRYKKARAPVPQTAMCEWTYDSIDCKWDSACGESWVFNDDGPVENRVKFCQGCGGKLTLISTPQDNSPCSS